MIIVYSYYVLDIIHKGHLEMLRNAKAIAGSDGRLIVGILTDEAAMEKKPKPILSFEERVEIAHAIKYVDLVVTQETYSPLNNILAIQPDILMESNSHATDYKVKQVIEDLGGRIICLPYFPEYSSTKIKKEICNE